MKAVTNFDREWPEPSPVPDDLAPAPAPRVARRGGARAIAVIVAFAVLVAAGVGAALTSWLSPASSPGAAPAAPREALARPEAPPVTRTVVYEVKSSGPDDIGSIEYTDQDGDIIRRGGVPFPWRTTFTVTGDHRPLVLMAQRKKGDTGPVTCSITFGEKVLTTVTQTGRYASAQCSA